MSVSLSSRLFGSMFRISLVTIALAFIAAEWVYEDIEDSILEIEFAAEREYFRQRITHPSFQEWETARLHAIFLGEGQPADALPELVHDLPIPYASEVNVGDNAYLVSTEHIHKPEGTFYLVQDISTLESREVLGQLAVLGVALLLLLLTGLLSQLAARRITAPLKHLTREISTGAPGKSLPRLSTDYREQEFVDIAEAFNLFLRELERFIQREKAFVSLASHELRTPLAVISGALDVIERRNQTSAADRETLARIRRATGEMQADVDILLKLARRRYDPDSLVEVDPTDSLSRVIEDLCSGNPRWKARIKQDIRGQSPLVETDPALVRILFRNLLQNALGHTSGPVTVAINNRNITVHDRGEGLPAEILAQIDPDTSTSDLPLRHATGFGLLIIHLVCERLGWKLRVDSSAREGTAMSIELLPE